MPGQRDERVGADETYERAWWKGPGPTILMTAFTATGVAYPRYNNFWVSLDSARGPSALEMEDVKDSVKAPLSLMKRVMSDLYRWVTGLRSVMVWTIVTTMAPEFYAFTALRQLDSARRWRRKFQQLPPGFHPPHGWTLTHMFFANMGGFAVVSNTVHRPRHVTTHLTALSLFYLIRQRPELMKPESLPSESEILDRSKSDAFAKSLVVFQVAWFVVNCITRLAKGISTTQVEMRITGTAICSPVTYATLFDKPRSVKTASVLVSLSASLHPTSQK